jgi:hypothetical protein
VVDLQQTTHKFRTKIGVDVSKIYSTNLIFAALKADESVVA